MIAPSQFRLTEPAAAWSRVGQIVARRWLGGLVGSAAASMLLAGCGSNTTPPPAQPGASTPSASSAANTAGAGNSAGSTAAANGPKAVFRLNAKSARDPFFPGTSRAVGQAADAAMVPRLPTASYLKLSGIRPGSVRPLALINKTPFSPGEEGAVTIVITNQLSKAEVQRINVRCLEIRKDSVLVSIAGESGVKELRIAQGK